MMNLSKIASNKKIYIYNLNPTQNKMSKKKKKKKKKKTLYGLLQALRVSLFLIKPPICFTKATPIALGTLFALL